MPLVRVESVRCVASPMLAQLSGRFQARCYHATQVQKSDHIPFFVVPVSVVSSVEHGRDLNICIVNCAINCRCMKSATLAMLV